MGNIGTCELVYDGHAVVGERPVWDPNENALVWVDIMGKKVFVMEETNVLKQSYSLSYHVGAAMPASQGGWLLATSEGFAFLSRDGHAEEIVDVLGGNPAVRFNDMGCDAQGRAFAGTMRYDLGGWEGALYRLESQGKAWRVTKVVTGLGLSNGIGWSVDGRYMYLVDSNPKLVYKFDYDLDVGALGERRVLFDCGRFEGIPDGLCVDAEGCVWIAFYGGGVVRRFGESGTFDREIRLPVSCPTCPGFGSGERLYITTAFSGDDVSLGSGGLWAVDVGVRGVETYCWSAKK